jgi:hypothetical protein
MYKTMLKPVAMHGYETWSITENEKVMLNMRERTILRKVYKPVTEQGVWGII